MPRLSIKELEKKLRGYYPNFSHVEVNGRHYIGRWRIKVMNGVNQLGYGITNREALESAIQAAKREKSSRAA